MSAPEPLPCALEVATLTDVGTARDHNEDACGSLLDTHDTAVVAVADGVSSSLGGEVASQMAVEVLLRACREEPATLPAGQRVYRAVQQANIEIYDRSVAVPELRGMATTLTAVAVERAELTVVHVGDSRAYLIQGGTITQLTRDHTAAAEKVRYGVMSRDRARTSPDRSVLTRSVGRELIVSRDRTGRRLRQGDALLLCSDGLYNVLEDGELLARAQGGTAAEACRRLVDAANARGTMDNLTAAVIRVVGPTPDEPDPAGGVMARVRRLLGR